ncbi:MAG TPA: hypothetical protein VGM94_14205 [Galbitalea sp.]
MLVLIPGETYKARNKAPRADTDGHWRIRQGRSDGTITLRFNSRMHHTGIGRAHKRGRERVLILDPIRDYQPQKPQNALQRRAKSERCPETSLGGTGGVVFPDIVHICLQTSFTVLERAEEPDYRDQRRR